MAIGAMIDDEIELRPVLRRLADIAGVGEGAQIGELAVERRREQALCTQTFLTPALTNFS